jgi:hypothetical protein
MKYVEILARNMYFDLSAENQMKDFRKKLRQDNGRKWFDTVFRRYIIKDYDGVFKLKNKSISYPNWVIKALNEGKEIVLPNFSLSIDEFEHWMDYINTLPSTRDLTRLSIPQLKKKIEEWDLSFKKSDEAGSNDYALIFQYSNNYKWVRINSKLGLEYEGSIMNHCVGDYWEQVREGMTYIYSLRDSQNKPHVTVEVTDDAIRQVKGKNNTIPVNYMSYILDLINSQRIPFMEINSLDVSRLGAITIDDKLYSLDKLPSHAEYEGHISDKDFKRIIEADKSVQGLRVVSVKFDNNKNIIIPNKTYINDLSCNNCNITTINSKIPRMNCDNSSIDFQDSLIYLGKFESCKITGNFEVRESITIHDSKFLAEMKCTKVAAFNNCHIDKISNVTGNVILINNCTFKSAYDFICKELFIIGQNKIWFEKPLDLDILSLNISGNITLPKKSKIRRLILKRNCHITNLSEISVNKLEEN